MAFAWNGTSDMARTRSGSTRARTVRRGRQVSGGVGESCDSEGQTRAYWKARLEVARAEGRVTECPRTPDGQGWYDPDDPSVVYYMSNRPVGQ